MKNLLRVGLWVGSGAALAVLMLELLLHLLPVAGRGVYAAEYDPAWPINHLLPHSTFTYSAGWKLDLVNEGSVNNMGYVAPFDYQRDAGGVAILGDSYIENLMNDYPVTLQGRLPALLHEPMPVLPFGSSGASMPDYLAVARLVADRFHPQWGVVLISEADFTEGFSPVPGYYGWDPQKDPPIRFTMVEGQRSPAKRLARQLALLRYVRYNLKMSPASVFSWRNATDNLPSDASAACSPAALSPADRELVRAFAADLPRQFRLAADRVIVIFDSDRNALYRTGTASSRCPTRDSEAFDQLRSHLRAAGTHVVETRDLFTDYYRTTGLKVDHSPLDWHWNGEAHRLVASRVAIIINHFLTPAMTSQVANHTVPACAAAVDAPPLSPAACNP